jgi:hypothetical protein
MRQLCGVASRDKYCPPLNSKNMKYLKLFVLLMVCSVGLVRGQRNDVLEYRMGSFDQKKHYPTSVRHNGAAVVKIRNVNQLIYDVEVAGKSTSFNTEVPDVWSKYMLSPSTSVAPGAAATLAADGGAPPPPPATKLAAAQADLAQLETLKSLMYGLQLVAYSLETDSANVVQKRDEWLERTGFKTKDVLASRGDLSLKVFQKIRSWEEGLQKFDEGFAKLAPPSDSEKLEKAEVDVLRATAKGTDYQKLAADILNLYDLLNAKTFTYTSAPISPDDNADELKLDIKIAPKPGLKMVVDAKTWQFSKRLPVRWGWKFDFSTGIAASGLNDEALALKSLGDTAGTLQIIQEVKHKSSFGVMALMHAHYRFGTPFTTGFSAGVMVDDSKRPRYLLGGSFILGNRQRIVLTMGAAYGKVNALSKTQEIGMSLPSGSNITYVERFRFGFFGGLSFNVTR